MNKSSMVQQGGAGRGSRRWFVSTSLLAGAGVMFVLSGGSAAWRTRQKSVRRDGAYRNDPLTDREWQTLEALAEVLYPPASEQNRSDLYRDVRWWVTKRVQLDSWGDDYRGAVGLLERRTTLEAPDRQFSELTVDERDAILKSLIPYGVGEDRLRQNSLASVLHNVGRALFMPVAWRLEHIVLPDMLQAIYSWEPGWRLVNYSSWPGTRAGAGSYTNKPADVVRL
jgi:ribosomal protein L24E